MKSIHFFSKTKTSNNFHSKRKLILFSFCLLCLLSSCKVFRSNLMLNTPEDFVYTKLSDSLTKLSYRLAPTDILQFKMYSRDGFKLIDVTEEGGKQAIQTDIESIIGSDGMCKMPLIGKIKLSGLTTREAEDLLEMKYEYYYVKPFVTIKVSNKRVIVFPGNGGMAKVVTLTNNNTTVIEALALAGGITEDAKAYKVKLIRHTDEKPQVYLMDLSRIEGLTAGNSVVLANDIIYVEPRYRLAKTIANELTPIITLLSTSIILSTFFSR